MIHIVKDRKYGAERKKVEKKLHANRGEGKIMLYKALERTSVILYIYSET